MHDLKFFKYIVQWIPNIKNYYKLMITKQFMINIKCFKQLVSWIPNIRHLTATYVRNNM